MDLYYGERKYEHIIQQKAYTPANFFSKYKQVKFYSAFNVFFVINVTLYPHHMCFPISYPFITCSTTIGKLSFPKLYALIIYVLPMIRRFLHLITTGELGGYLGLLLGCSVITIFEVLDLLIFNLFVKARKNNEMNTI